MAICKSFILHLSTFVLTATQIMDGIISAPICLAGFFLLPDLPENTRAFYLNDNVRTPLLCSYTAG